MRLRQNWAGPYPRRGMLSSALGVFHHAGAEPPELTKASFERAHRYHLLRPKGLPSRRCGPASTKLQNRAASPDCRIRHGKEMTAQAGTGRFQNNPEISLEKRSVIDAVLNLGHSWCRWFPQFNSGMKREHGEASTAAKSVTAPATVSGERRQRPLAHRPGRLAKHRPASQETCHHIVTNPGRGVLEGALMSRLKRMHIGSTFCPRLAISGADCGRRL